MSWILKLLADPDSIATSILILTLVGGVGLGIGSIKFRGLSLGIAGVLFSGLLFGHFGFSINSSISHFASEFGLVLFVYAVGLQVGPGFFSALRAEGLPLNLCALGTVVGGAVLTLLLAWGTGVSFPVAIGVFSGATTNTPSLAAATQALTVREPDVETMQRAFAEVDPQRAAELSRLPAEKRASALRTEFGKIPSLGYAVAYPFGVLGIILVMLLIRALLTIDLGKESEELRQIQKRRAVELSRLNLIVTNPNLVKKPIAQIPALEHFGVVISRILHNGELAVAHPDTLLAEGDTVLAVGKPESLEELRVIVGEKATVDLYSLPSEITARRLVVTRKEVVGRTINDLDLLSKLDVQITRIRRADIEFPASPEIKLQYADRLQVVGAAADLDEVAAALGNSPKQLDHPEVVTICFGIVLGVLLGSWPIPIPGIPEPVKLGLAGGPLLVAIVLSQLGKVGPFVSHVPMSANFIMRELGIVLFLAAVGLRSGDRFVQLLSEGNGLTWMAMGAVVTFIPLFTMALIARLFMGMNFLHLLGVLAGSMTDPPALSFANTLSQSEAPSVSYATVYPLTMIARVLTAQIMVTMLV